MLTKGEQRRLKNWEEDITMPRWKYILIHGVIGWGVTVSVLITLFELIFNGKSLRQQGGEDLWLRLLIFCFMGIFMGLIMRWIVTKQLTKLKEKEKQTNQ